MKFLKKIGELVQEADWKAEKHVPVIECADAVKADELFEVKVTIGKEITHPNTTARNFLIK
jgi:superoxide reductase